MPVRNNNGMDVNTTSSITFSLYLTRHESIIPKKIHDSMNGVIKPIRSVPLIIDVKPKKRGTHKVIYAPITAYIIR